MMKLEVAHFSGEERRKAQETDKEKTGLSLSLSLFFFWRGGACREDSMKLELLGTTIHARVVVSSMVVLVCRVYFVRSYINLSFDLIEFFFHSRTFCLCCCSLLLLSR